MRQNILLLEDVENLGRSGEAVSVKSGYARNFLFPKKMAVIADKNTLRMQARLQEERAKKAAADKKASDEVAKHIEGMVLTIDVKVDPEMKMYGSVGTLDILRLFSEKGYEFDKSNILLKHPIKEIGVHDLVLKLKEGVTATYHLKIVPEGAGLAVIEEEVKEALEEEKEEQARIDSEEE